MTVTGGRFGRPSGVGLKNEDDPQMAGGAVEIGLDRTTRLTAHPRRLPTGVENNTQPREAAARSLGKAADGLVWKTSLPSVSKSHCQ